MDTKSIENMLALLRHLRASEPAGNLPTGLLVVQNLVGNDSLLTLQGAQQIMEQADLACTAIRNSYLDEEAKEGVLQTLEGIRTAFSLHHLPSGWRQFIPNPTTAIGSLVVILSAAGIERSPLPEDEISAFRSDIEAMIREMNAAMIDPIVKEVGLRHLQMLATLLAHIPIFGLEAAITQYFDLLAKMKRADSKSSAESHERTKPFWERMKGWKDRFSTISDLIDAGVRLSHRGSQALNLLEHLPGFI